jgi:hypothetical protein
MYANANRNDVSHDKGRFQHCASAPHHHVHIPVVGVSCHTSMSGTVPHGSSLHFHGWMDFGTPDFRVPSPESRLPTLFFRVVPTWTTHFVLTHNNMDTHLLGPRLIKCFGFVYGFLLYICTRALTGLLFLKLLLYAAAAGSRRAAHQQQQAASSKYVCAYVYILPGSFVLSA